MCNCYGVGTCVGVPGVCAQDVYVYVPVMVYLHM